MFVHLPEKSLILLSVTVCGFFLCTVSASDIVSDTQQEEPDAVWDVTLPEQEERSIENNTAFYAVLNELSRTRSFTDAQIKKLFEVLDKTPDSPFLAANLLSELRLNNKAGLLTEQFSALAQKHPSRFMLTAIAADLLQMQKRNQDAIALLRKAADYLMAAENRDELLHRKPNYAEYILLKLAILLAMEKDYESSEKLIQRIASWKDFKDNLFLKQLSLINYAAMRKTASDSRLLWIFPSEKEKMREKFDRTAEEYLKEVSELGYLKCRPDKLTSQIYATFKNGQYKYLAEYALAGSAFFMPKTEQINSECKAFVWLQNKLKGSYKPYTDKGKAAAKQRNLQECVTEVMKDLRQTARTREQCINTAKLLYQLADSAVRLSVEKTLYEPVAEHIESEDIVSEPEPCMEFG